jgi:hypothetical protein
MFDDPLPFPKMPPDIWIDDRQVRNRDRREPVQQREEHDAPQRMPSSPKSATVLSTSTRP